MMVADKRSRLRDSLLPDGAAAIAIGEARLLAKHHAGVIVCTCEAKSAIGAEREPVVIWRAGAVGDFH